MSCTAISQDSLRSLPRRKGALLMRWKRCSSRSMTVTISASGYLTIKDYDPYTRSYRLDFQNNEQSEGRVGCVIETHEYVYILEFKKEARLRRRWIRSTLRITPVNMRLRIGNCTRSASTSPRRLARLTTG